MGILGSNRNQQQRSSGGVLGRRQREENEQRMQRYEASKELGIGPLDLQASVKERFPLPSPVSASDQWVEDKLTRDREQASRNPVFRTINRVLEPVSRRVYGAVANIPGVAAFQEGTGAALGIKTDTAPVTGPKAINTAARVAGNIVGSLTNPTNLSQGLVTAPYRIGQGVAQASAQRAPALTNRYAQRGIEGAVAGGIQGGVISGARGETDADELARNIGIGVGLGAAGDVALAGLSDAARAVIGRYRGRSTQPAPAGQLALPAPRERGNANTATPPDVVSPEYTFGLPEPSPASTQRMRNIDEGRADLTVIDDEIRQLEASYERAVVDEYKYLKQSMQERGGVQQGQLQRGVDGEVAGRTGRISNNPLWYQEYFSANGRAPSNRELFRLARERIDNGFQDEAGNVPSWRDQNRYGDNMNALLDVRDTLSTSLRELDPAITITDAPLKRQELGFTRTTPKREQPSQPTAVEPSALGEQIPNPVTFKTSKGSTYSVNADGTTQRNKTLHQGHAADDVGLKDASEATVYVPASEAQRIGSHFGMNKESRPQVLYRDDGIYLVSWNSKENRWGLNGKPIPYTMSPEVGRSPIEMWQIGTDPTLGRKVSRVHAGNEIVEVGDPNSPAAVASDVAPGPVAADVELPPRTNLPEADTSLGISRTGNARKYTNPEDTRQDIATKTDREPLNVEKWADDFYRSNVDNLNRLNDFDKFIEKEIGRKLNPDEKSHLLALNARGADMTSRHILTERMVDSQGRVIGKSLKDITSQVPSNKQTYDNFVDYLIARHAPTRMRRGETVYPEARQMTPEKAEAKTAEYERIYPEFARLANEIDTWNDTIGRAWLVDTGIIPKQVFDQWRKDNPFWIPNQRKFTDLEKRQRATGARRGYGNQNNPVKKYSETGSQRQIIDPFEALIEYTDRYVKTARRNEVMQTIYRQLKRNPDELDGFATILKREKTEKITDDITSLLDELDDEFDKAFLRKSDLDKDNVISALVDGERVYMRVEDPELLDSLVNLSPQGRNAVIEGARKVTNTMKLLTTGINPIFGLTRNIFRDIPEAYIYSKTTDNPFVYAWDTLQAFASVFADGAGDAVGGSRMLQKAVPQRLRDLLDKQARLYKDYKALGGGHSSPAASNRNLLAQSKRDLLPQQRTGARAFSQRAWSALENLNNALESGPRLGEFKRSREAGGDTYGSRVQGIFEAQDVTTNFKRHGQVVRDADAVLPYLNAAVQGLDKLIRSFKDRRGAVVGKALGVIAAPTIALYAMNYNNPEYQKLSNHIKDNFYLLPTTDGKFVRIPKPRELGVPFGGLLERAMRAWNEDDPEAFRDFANTAATMFTPPGVPLKEIVKGDIVGAAIRPIRDTVAGPLIDVAANENFMGSPIVPGYLENLSPRLQYDANTSEISKKIGDIANVSPKQVDHIIRSYSGVLGQIGLPAATQGATVGDTLVKQVTADPVFSTDASKYFYEMKEKLDTQYADAKATGVAPKGYTPASDAARKYLGQVTDQMADYTKAIREVDNSDTLSRAQKKDYKRQLTDQRNILARQAYESVRDVLEGSAK